MSGAPGYLDELGEALARAGLGGARRRRILAEFADHLECDPEADLGDPAALAAQFADELGTSFARSAAFTAFAALAVTGVLVVVRVAVLLPLKRIDSGVDTAALLVCMLAGQVAFVCGGLGLARALRLRHARTIPRQEASVLARRAGIGLATGAVAALTVPVRASVAGSGAVGAPGVSIAAACVAVLALALAAPSAMRAARLRPLASGPADDLLADLGPVRPLAARLTGGSATRLALLTATGLALVIALAGIVADDPYDGILRGLIEAGALLGCYAALGRYLGLRH